MYLHQCLHCLHCLQRALEKRLDKVIDCGALHYVPVSEVSQALVLCVAEVKAGRPEVELMEDIEGS